MTDVIHKSGKRKSATARATLYPDGEGKVKVNNRRLDSLNDEMKKLKMKEPLILAGDAAEDIDIKVNVEGGGKNGQAEATRLAIARALVEYESSLEEVFNEYDRLLLVADVRRKESSKPGRQSKARAKRQKSYR